MRKSLKLRTEVQETEKRKLNVLQILFAAERRSDLESEQIEQISIEFKQFPCALILLSCFYRPPDSTVSFFDSLANIVDSVTVENKEVHIVGDFNVDLIKKSTSESKQILNKAFMLMTRPFMHLHLPYLKSRRNLDLTWTQYRCGQRQIK